MKKILLATACVMMLAGCAQEGGRADRDSMIATDNAARVIEFLETKMMPESADVSCAFEKWAQPAGNVIEGWALCTDVAGNDVSSAVKVWFANPSLLIRAEEGENFSTFVWKNFSKTSARRIFKNEFDLAALEVQLAERRAMPDEEVVEMQGVGGE